MKNNKLILKEEMSEDEVIDFSVGTYVSNLIKSKWDMVDSINGIIISLQGSDDATVEILKDIISDEYVHIGQLEKIIKGVAPEAIGLDEAEKEIDIS